MSPRRDEMIVTAHQPNFLPGESIITKLEASDAVLWLDEVQFTKNGWINRNYLSNMWLTVPVQRNTDGQPINRVRIAEHGKWRMKMVDTIQQRVGKKADVICEEIMRPYRLLVGLNAAILRHLYLDVMRMSNGQGDCAWHFQSHLDGGHAVRAVSMESDELLPISDRLAMMVEEVGGDVYLSGPSGKNYLDETPFKEREIEVRYWTFSEPNLCSVFRYN